MEASLRDLFERMQFVRMAIQPNGHCQACCSETSSDKDFMLTCDMCLSSVHNGHYGREIHEVPLGLDDWRCERCRTTLAQWEKGVTEMLKCEFCPSERGIMKRLSFANKIVW